MFNLLYRARQASLCALIAGPLLSPGVYAANSLEAHEHGHATLDIAIEEKRIDLYFKSPAINLIGFEHAPQNDEERNQLKNAIAWFDKNRMIDIADQTCELSQSAIEETVTHETEAHREHEHEHEHEHEGDHSDHDGAHSEFIVSQVLVCDTDLTGASASVGLLQQFHGIEELDVSWVTGSRQGGAELTRESMTIQFND